ncbi:MAG TPA: glycosyltransferase family 2 protein [Paludibacter sp.]|nr:glycosyltransferase family 2 protein [Paludibacter sp.]
MTQKIDLSLVVLCYRSEENIIPLVEKLTKLLEGLHNIFEIVLVGNYFPGSEDRTKEIVLDLASKDQRIKAIAKPKEGMMGWDMLEGMKSASGEYICVIDGDGQFPFESVIDAYNIIKQKNLDMVKTYRIVRYDGRYRTIISKMFNLLFNSFFPGLHSQDINSKPKIISRRVFEKMDLKSTGWFIDAEIMINIRRLKCTFEEFPVEFHEINVRKSFVKIEANFEFLRELIKYRIKEFFIKNEHKN